jgi:hypothetical protein
MLLRAAGGLWLAWLLGLAGLYDIGRGVHALLLAALWLLFFAALKSRDRSMRQASDAAREASSSQRVVGAGNLPTQPRAQRRCAARGSELRE